MNLQVPESASEYLSVCACCCYHRYSCLYHRSQPSSILSVASVSTCVSQMSRSENRRLLCKHITVLEPVFTGTSTTSIQKQYAETF